MNIKRVIFGERSLTKVAGLFADQDAAQHAAEELKQHVHLDDEQVKLVGPADSREARNAALSRKLEPEQSGIWHTLIRAHVFAGSVGAVLGILIYLGLFLTGNPAIVSTPWMSFLVMLFFGMIAGLLVGGLLTLRPDHYRVIAAVRRAVKHGRWAVVTHPVTPAQIEQTVHELRGRGYRVVRSF